MNLSLTFRQKQIGSVLLTFLVYTFILRWQVALLMVVSVGFHEYSHLVAARKLGLKTKGFFLLPFMGGVAFIDDKYKTQKQNAIVALAGPAGGALLALVTFLVYKVTGIVFLGQAVIWMCLLNLFNLLPLSFLDGGQTMGTITYSINRTLGFYCMAISTVIAFFLFLYLNIVLACLVLLFGGAAIISEWKQLSNYKAEKHLLCSDDYLYPPKKLSKMDMVNVMVSWAAVSIILAWMLVVLLPESSLQGNLFAR